MCNPRRIRVRATRELAEAWEQEVRRQATRSGSVSGEARVRESLADSVGGPTLAALTDVISQAEGWVQTPEGAFRHELDGGHIVFDPGSRELEIVAAVSGDVSVTAEASATFTTELSGTVDVQGEGVYYDDGWGGRTRESARREAERNRDLAMERELRERRSRAERDAETSAGASVERRAAERAEAAFGTAATARAEELRREAERRLLAVGVEGRALFNAALADAYRDAFLAYARRRGASNVSQSEHDGVLDIEFELEV